MIITDLSILRKKNDMVNKDEVIDIISKLEFELRQSPIHGVGLAAPQIGINKTAAIIRYTADGISETIDLINPKIIEKTGSYLNKNESCLSLPGQVFNTQRHREVFVIDDLHPSGFVACGFVATILEHEIDHLEGILIIDRAVGKLKIGRNDPCPCGSNLKFKKCHGK